MTLQEVSQQFLTPRRQQALKKALADEIVQRYYDRFGRRAQEYKVDPFVDSAAVILNDPAKYKEILTPAKKK